MKLTPLDIHHKEFHRAIRGYSEEEVDKFLDEVAEEFERLFKDNIELKEQIEKIKQQLDGYADMEKTLHNTLLTAQKSAEEVLSHAKKESELVLRDAELKAKETIQEAHDLKGRYEATLGHLKQAEEEFRNKFKSMLESYLRIADSTAVLADIGSELSGDSDMSEDLENAMNEKLSGPGGTLGDVTELPKIDIGPIVEETEIPKHASAFTGETFGPDMYPTESVNINLATGTNDYAGITEFTANGGLPEFTPGAGIPDMSSSNSLDNHLDNDLDNHIEIDFAVHEENKKEENEEEKRENRADKDEFDLDNLAF
jgi:cell division initiation protein